MEVSEAVNKRRSIREFKDIAVPYDMLEKCVDAARLAPSTRNRQPCEYIIVDDEPLLPQVFDTVRLWFATPPPGRRPRAYIITLVNSTSENELGGVRKTTIYDVGMAAENIMLVALEHGLGTCAILSYQERVLRQTLNIPAKYEIALMLALGFPDESPVVEAAAGSVRLWRDHQGVRHIPKRNLKDIFYRNRFP
ncbi:MAG: nitroreductase family protein [Dehalococcoidales bacterium]|jgi:nitroreductase|nr:nitroreductase family protein [Dehalococcoidales bacterium]